MYKGLRAGFVSENRKVRIFGFAKRARETFVSVRGCPFSATNRVAIFFPPCKSFVLVEVRTNLMYDPAGTDMF